MGIFAGDRCGFPWTSWKATWLRSWLTKKQRFPGTRRPSGRPRASREEAKQSAGTGSPRPGLFAPAAPFVCALPCVPVSRAFFRRPFGVVPFAPGPFPICRGLSHFPAPASALTFPSRPDMIGRRLYTKIGDFPGLFLPLLKTLQNLCTFAGNRAKIIGIASGPPLTPFFAGCSAKPRKDVIS